MLDSTVVDAEPRSAFVFHGRWREFLPIALSNLLLTLVTLGIYQFWAKARERRYLWSRTQFVDERLEWAGTGREMFIGFIIVMLLFLPAILFMNFGFQALIFRGEPELAAIGFAVVFVASFYLVGVARFRALRYRLSRTYWRGIRGGSDDPGWRYGVSYFWKSVAGIVALGLLVPWSMVSLFRERWRAMSFGPHPFEAGGETAVKGLMGRWMLIYASPILLVLLLGLLLFGLFGAAALGRLDTNNPAIVMTLAFGVVAGVYLVIPLVTLAYFAAFYRKVISELRLGSVGFTFNARTKDWVKLILGHIGLVIVTLGLGFVFIAYRNWSFFIRHLEADGEIDLASLTQSTTSLGSDAEGLAAAFDIGAV